MVLDSFALDLALGEILFPRCRQVYKCFSFEWKRVRDKLNLVNGQYAQDT